MPVIGGERKGDKVPREPELTRQAEIGIAVEMELGRYRQTLRDIDASTEQRKLAAQQMFANRIEAIVQRISPLVNGEHVSVSPDADKPE